MMFFSGFESERLGLATTMRSFQFRGDACLERLRDTPSIETYLFIRRNIQVSPVAAFHTLRAVIHNGRSIRRRLLVSQTRVSASYETRSRILTGQACIFLPFTCPAGIQPQAQRGKEIVHGGESKGRSTPGRKKMNPRIYHNLWGRTLGRDLAVRYLHRPRPVVYRFLWWAMPESGKIFDARGR
jgi:hypothetical protein